MTPNFMTFVLGKRNSILAQNRARQRAAFSQPPSTNRSRDREGAFAGLSQGPNAPSRSRLVVQPSALGLHGSGGTAQRRPRLLGSAHHGVRVAGVVGFPLPDQCQQLFPHAFNYPRHRNSLQSSYSRRLPSAKMEKPHGRFLSLLSAARKPHRVRRSRLPRTAPGSPDGSVGPGLAAAL